MGLPGIALMLWGGASADRRDPRGLLVWVYGLSSIFPLFLVYADQINSLTVLTVGVWGMGMSIAASFTMPAQQAILNRVSGSNLQRGISASTAIGFLVQITGVGLAGQMDRFGLSTVLVLQAACLAIGALMIQRLPVVSLPPSAGRAQHSALHNIMEGLRATYRTKVIFHVLMINFVSSIFNAGAFMTVFPFIMKRVYDGDALMLAVMIAVFYAGGMISSLVMFALMPFKHPGRLFLIMQLSRVVVIFCLWFEPVWWLLVVVILAWGVNMGFTSTLARTVVQESAEPGYRGRVLSVFSLGMMGSAPIGALVLGWIIETFGTLNALLPAIGVSLVLCAYGVMYTGIWSYRSQPFASSTPT